MTRKVLIAAAAGVLICGAWGSSALAKAKHHHQATQTAAAQPQAPTVPGNNPSNNPKTVAPIAGAQASSAIVGNNPMANPKPSAGGAAGAPSQSAVVGNSAMGVAKK